MRLTFRNIKARNINLKTHNVAADPKPPALTKSGKPRAKRIEHEEIEQADFFEQAHWEQKRYPDIQMAFHVPNGGHRSWKTAKKLKKQGVKSGVPDIVVPIVTTLYPGLYIEMKAEDGTMEPQQQYYAAFLAQQGYLVAVAWDWESAWALATWYHDLPRAGAPKWIVTDIKGFLEKQRS